MSLDEQEISILVVDDDEEDYMLLRDHFNEIPDRKFQIDWAPSYEAGLKLLKAKAFDICFLDYRLGNQTGLDLLKQLQIDDIRVPVILLTGYGQRDVDLEAMKLGAADYLVKDQVTHFMLEKTVRYALHRAEMKAQILMQDRLASIGLLASSLAHEIGTPLGVIRGRAEYVASFSKNDSNIEKNMNVIIAQIDRVSKLIYSLLNLARGGQTQGTGLMSLTLAVSDVLELMSHEITKNEITIVNEVSDNVSFRLSGQQESLHQVLLNFIVNSIHAIQSAKRLGRFQDHHIKVYVEKKKDFVCLSIEDTGCGISKANLNHLFKPFFTTKDIGAGTGLGLVTSYRIVESWNGTIQVESEEGVGTTFKILLPIELE